MFFLVSFVSVRGFLQFLVLLFTRLTSLSLLPLSRPDGPRSARSPGLSVPPRGHQAGIPLHVCWTLCPAGQQPEPRGESCTLCLYRDSNLHLLLTLIISRLTSAAHHTNSVGTVKDWSSVIYIFKAIPDILSSCQTLLLRDINRKQLLISRVTQRKV